MKRIPAALWLWYQGGAFRGYQSQPQGPTVQDSLEAAFAALGLDARPVPSGRTDRGVHARMQVVSLRLPGDTALDSLPARLAPHLPSEMGLAAARLAPRGFHAQWTAMEKEYRYRVCPDVAPEAWRGHVWELGGEPALAGRALDVERMRAVLARYCGTHDFYAFHEKSSPRRPRTLLRAECHVSRDGVLEVRLVGEGFARYMVRYLVGYAVAVGCGILSEEAVAHALATGEETRGLRAPSRGLILWEVRYPPSCDPFPEALRQNAPGLPDAPPFRTPHPTAAKATDAAA